jgi:FkbM family methyltransferase
MMLENLALKARTEARTLARKLGLLAHLGRLKRRADRLLGRDGYEHAFQQALERAVRPGDVVWDIGANVGLYSREFSRRAGPTGVVCAFEPMPPCLAQLQQNCVECGNLRTFGIALGERAAELPLWTSTDPLGATHSLISHHHHQSAAPVTVRVAAGDELIAHGEAPAPNVLKIDVEGFEEDVLKGLTGALARPECRSVLIEVHFAILEERGERHAPARIQSLLRERGFDVTWTDASHLAATRRN